MTRYKFRENVHLIADNVDVEPARVVIRTNKPVKWWMHFQLNVDIILAFVERYSGENAGSMLLVHSLSFNDSEIIRMLSEAWDAAPDDVPKDMMPAFVAMDQLITGSVPHRAKEH